MCLCVSQLFIAASFVPSLFTGEVAELDMRALYGISDDGAPYHCPSLERACKGYAGYTIYPWGRRFLLPCVRLASGGKAENLLRLVTLREG